MKVEKRIQKDVMVLAISRLERLDASTSAELRKSLLDNMGDSSLKVVVNMQSVRHIDSSGLSVFISLNKVLRKRNGDLKLCSLAPTVRSMFELTRLHRVFDLLADEEQAIAAFEG